MPKFCSGLSAASEPLDTLRITDREWRQLVDEIDRAEARRDSSKCPRRHERVSYRKQGFLTAVMHGESGQFKVLRLRTCDLSEQGLGFLYGQFMYTGTPMTLVLQHATEGDVTLEGVVRRCDHFNRHIHRVGIEFTTPINPEAFILAAAA